MNTLFAGLHIESHQQEYITLNNIDFEKNVFKLKERLAEKLEDYDPNNIEIVYNGNVLNDDEAILGTVIKSDTTQTVHCFKKTSKYVPFVADPEITSAATIARVEELFNVISHIQINVNSRVNILQKILAEYPEFRRNLGAQALIRDSVLFNTLHQPEVIKNIAEHYPIIVEAAPSIVDTIKKELTRSTSTNFSEPATDSTNSSEEENSLGASTNSDRTTSEDARIRTISRQQLEAALAQIGLGSVNSLSNIAQRNVSSDGERITSERLRSELHRAISNLGSQQQPTQPQQEQDVQQMDTSETADISTSNVQQISEDGNGDIPNHYRTHQYAEQLRIMFQMGFIDYEENLTYLNLTNGNIENAINLLMGAMN